jgi:predicted DNA binding CopG/RHH family protein
VSKLKKTKARPKSSDEAVERRFWQEHDTAGLVDWSKARRATFPNLKPSTQTISLRLPIALLHRLKTRANRDDVPYQSLLKILLSEALDSPSPARSRRATSTAKR